MNKPRVTAIIPARMSASRFPGKPLATILDLPMIEHVRRRVQLSHTIDDVFVATCDDIIAKIVTKYGGKVLMTAPTHERCTDRVEEAARQLKTDIIVIVQGDEPLLIPNVLDQFIKAILITPHIQCSNLLSPIKTEADFLNIDIVKAVLDQESNIMYLSRAPIPYSRTHHKTTLYRQTGISTFTKLFLHEYAKLAPSSLEILESIDFLRILEHQYHIKGISCEYQTIGVEQPEHIHKVETLINADKIQKNIYHQIINI